jgi:uncharacterized protein DUF2264
VIRWQPFDDVTVESRLEPVEGGHRREHRIVTGRSLYTAEGGFCVPWAIHGNEPHATAGGPGAASAAAGGLESSIVDSDGGRAGEIVWPMPGSHILFPRTVLPTLRGSLEPGTHILACEVRVTRVPAGPDSDAADRPEPDGTDRQDPGATVQ